MRIAAIGDLMLDVIVRLDEPLVPGDDVRRATRIGAGGQAANVAAWAASLGADARFVGKRGDDAAGELVARELAAHGVEVVGPVGAGGPASSSRSSAPTATGRWRRTAASRRASRRTSSIRRGSTATSLHVSGYSLLREPIGATARCAARLARERGARVSVDVSAWTVIRDDGPGGSASCSTRSRPTSSSRPRRERESSAARSSRRWSGDQARRRAADVVTGTRGSTSRRSTTEVVDTTGAGDALAAGFLVGGRSRRLPPRLEAAARCVAKLGAMP